MKLAILIEGQCEGLEPSKAAKKFGLTRQRYHKILQQFKQHGAHRRRQNDSCLPPHYMGSNYRYIPMNYMGPTVKAVRNSERYIRKDSQSQVLTSVGL